VDVAAPALAGRPEVRPSDASFVAERPDQVRLADISYIATDEDWLYLAAARIWRHARSSAGQRRIT
jgi:hypothetical protein